MAAQEAINDIIFCNTKRCASDCGTQLDICEQGIFGADAVAADVADIAYTTNKGETWTNTAAQPFGNDEDIISVTCFAKDKDTTRWMAIRGAEATPTNPAEIAYSDDTGATWTNVDLESGGTRYAVDSGALFAIDWYNIWAVISDGYIFKSTDGGATWTNQFIDPGSNDLHAVNFANENVGYAVGAAGVVFKTDDGGATWTATTVTDAGQINNCVYVFSEDRVVVGENSGVLYVTTDGGTTWTAMFTGATSINDVMFADDYVGFLIDGDEVYRTRDGGNSWEHVTCVAEATEFNAVWVCNPNLAYVAGEDASNEGEIVKLSG